MVVLEGGAVSYERGIPVHYPSSGEGVEFDPKFGLKEVLGPCGRAYEPTGVPR